MLAAARGVLTLYDRDDSVLFRCRASELYVKRVGGQKLAVTDPRSGASDRLVILQRTVRYAGVAYSAERGDRGSRITIA